MKKITITMALILLVTSCLTGCSKKEDDQSAVQGEGSVQAQDAGNQQQGAPEPDEHSESSISATSEKLVVADAPMYRGIITAISSVEDYYEIALESVDGTDYMYEKIILHTDENSNANFDFADLKSGGYLEVYYADRTDGLPPTVIAANMLPDAELCMFNGTVRQYSKEDGKLEMESITGSKTVIFNFDDSTQFYMNTDDIVEGTQLNIFHRGVMTKSNPPQGFAYEVRPYKAPAEQISK